MAENLDLKTEEKEYVIKSLQTLIFNVADCIGLLISYQEPDSKRNIIKDILQMDLEYLIKLDSFIKEKFNKGDQK